MKKKNVLKFVGLILVLVIAFSSFSTLGSTVALAAEENDLSLLEEAKSNKGTFDLFEGESLQSAFDGKTLRSYEYIYNLDDSADYIYVEFEEGGYVVFSSETMEMMEYSLQGTLPYSSSNAKKYYAGPTNYLQKTDSKFVNMRTNEELEITAAEAVEFSKQVRNEIKAQTSYRSNLSAGNGNIADKINESLHLAENEGNNTARGSVPKYDNGNLIELTVGTGTLIANYGYFAANPTIGRNYDKEVYGNGNTETCGAVAAQILLGYNNYYNDRRIIDDKYLNGYDDATNTVKYFNKNPNHCTDPRTMNSDTTGTRSESTGTNSFYCRVIDAIMEPNTDGASIEEIYNGIKEVLSDNIISTSYSIDYDIKGWFFGYYPIDSTPIKDEIDAGRPIMIGISKHLTTENHMVVGYGYTSYTYPNGGGTYDGYIVHAGWQGDTCVWINSAWCNSYISLKMNHIHSYAEVGNILGTIIPEYKCSICGHRTDAGISFEPMTRYAERVAYLPQNGYTYKDFYVTFKISGTKLFQTFGPGDAKMYLFDGEYNQLKYDDDSGKNLNSLFQYNVEANKPYILRVQFYSASTTGSIKVGITPADGTFNTFENIYNANFTPFTLSFIAYINTTHIMSFSPPETGTYTIEVVSGGDTSMDTYVYVIDTYTTSVCLYDDDSGEDLEALITANLLADRTYIVIASPYDIHATTGSMILFIEKVP